MYINTNLNITSIIQAFPLTVKLLYYLVDIGGEYTSKNSTSGYEANDVENDFPEA